MKQSFTHHDQIIAAPGSSPDDFDFLTGSWKIYNRKLKTRLDNCQEWLKFEATTEMKKILHGKGNTDSFIGIVNEQPFEGMTLRLFNPVTNLWSIYWADSIHVILDTPVIGSFDNNIGRFYTKDIFDGKEILVQFKWDKTNPEEPVWSQAFSADKGKTWEWNWYMNFYRADYSVESQD